MESLAPLDVTGQLLDLAKQGVEPDKLQAMGDFLERMVKLRREELFTQAMNSCQADMPTVVRDKRNSETGKLYAPVETVQAYAKPVYIRHGFSLSFGTEVGSSEGLTHCYVDVAHTSGHVKRFYLHNVALDNKGMKGGATKTDVQGLMSSLSYAQGRLIRLAFNVTVADEDRDGQLETMSPDQAGVFNAALSDLEACFVRAEKPESEWGKYVSWLKKWQSVENWGEMTTRKMTLVLDEIRRKRKEFPK